MRVIWATVAAALLVALGSGWWAYSWIQRLDQPLDPDASVEILDVPTGITGRKLGDLLEERGLIESRWLYRLLLQLQPDGPAAKAGRHEVSASMSPRELRKRLGQAPLPEDVPFTVVEGWRLRDTDAALAELGFIQAGDYVTAASRPGDFVLPFSVESPTLEGYLYPETYAFVPDRFDLHAFIQRQLDTFVEKFFQPYGQELARDLHTVVVVASMLEREEPKPAVRPKVAGVMYNRIDRGIALGVDATSRYSLDAWNDRKSFLARLRDPQDPYNTRLRTGLPPTAIGAPSLPSLTAAAEPESVPHLYYLHDAQQRIHFARSAQEHEANRRKYNVW
jgi:UPF0755 protein